MPVVFVTVGLAAALAAAPATAAGSSSQAGATPSGTSSTGPGGSGGAGLGLPVRPRSAPRRKTKRRAKVKTATKRVAVTQGDSKHLGGRVLRPGMTGHDVRVLQAYLSLSGYPASIDGDYGSATLVAVKAFQSDNGFSANGVVTVAVEQALRAKVKAIEADPPASVTRINGDGTATAPAGAPAVVSAVIAAANKIIDTPYIYGGGHSRWNDSGYDCSGAVSFVLHGGGLLSSPEDSTSLESYGAAGRGHWITIYADSSHAFMVVAGRAFDTANYGGPNIPGGTGPRWRSNPTGNLADGGNYVVRHPSGL
jgi:peptidoglycan hydrolase-like protein with peptidoglycan-binding domain